MGCISLFFVSTHPNLSHSHISKTKHSSYIPIFIYPCQPSNLYADRSEKAVRIKTHLKSIISDAQDALVRVLVMLINYENEFVLFLLMG